MTDDNGPDDLPMPLPLEIVEDSAAYQAFFPDGDPTPETPLGTAFMWWTALLNLPDYRTALENLSINPADWDGYDSIAQELSGWSLMQGIMHSEDAPDRLAYAKFMEDTGWSMRAFDAAPLDEAYILTLARTGDGWWRVWGISKNYIPPAEQVFLE